MRRSIIGFAALLACVMPVAAHAAIVSPKNSAVNAVTALFHAAPPHLHDQMGLFLRSSAYRPDDLRAFAGVKLDAREKPLEAGKADGIYAFPASRFLEQLDDSSPDFPAKIERIAELHSAMDPLLSKQERARQKILVAGMKKMARALGGPTDAVDASNVPSASLVARLGRVFLESEKKQPEWRFRPSSARLIERLDRERGDVLLGSIAEASATGDSASPAVIRMLRDIAYTREELSARLAAVLSLNKIGEAAVESLIELARSAPVGALRASAIEGLAALSPESAVLGLSSILIYPIHQDEHVAAAVKLGAIGGKSAILALASVDAGSSLKVQVAAVEELGRKLYDKDAYAAVKRFMLSYNRSEIKAVSPELALKMIARFGEAGSSASFGEIQALKTLAVSHENDAVNRAAVRALARMGDSPAATLGGMASPRSWSSWSERYEETLELDGQVRSPGNRSAQYAVWELGRLKTDAAVQELERAAYGPHAVDAVEQLARMGGNNAIRALTVLATDRNSLDIRLRAAEALVGKVSDPEARASLRRLSSMR